MRPTIVVDTEGETVWETVEPCQESGPDRGPGGARPSGVQWRRREPPPTGAGLRDLLRLRYERRGFSGRSR